MNRNYNLLFALFFVSAILYGQKNKFENILNSKKLGVSYKKVKKNDKDDFYQQYYWLKKMEELQAFPHLKDIKPRVLYSFVKEIAKPIPTKSLTKEQKEFREQAEHSLNEFFRNKKWDDKIMIFNLKTFVDPESKKYLETIQPEKIVTLLPKRLYSYTTINAETKEQKIYYLFVKENEYKIVDVVPDKKKNEIFYDELKRELPGFEFPKLVLESAKPGDKKVKKDINYIYLTPFQLTDNNIVYKTEDFEEFILVKYKKDGGAWTDVEHRKRKW